LSWVLDERGIYYDATRPSDLEEILQRHAFSAEELQRAASLRQALVAAGLTKYNVAGGSWTRPATARRVILVPGQVESDASIRYGAPGVRTNMGLLQAVSAANSDAYVIYKPHPDVVAGLRDAGEGEARAAEHCDARVIDVPMDALIAQVDEVHVLTSLAGFEALLRGKPVTCHGQPFYAGWGLTNDVQPIARRTRRLTLDELVAGALILYPRYVDRANGRPITPEAAVEELVRWRSQTPPGVPLWRTLFRQVLRFVVPLR
jgi:capsular polysaccharide export protein